MYIPGADPGFSCWGCQPSFLGAPTSDTGAFWQKCRLCKNKIIGPGWWVGAPKSFVYRSATAFREILRNSFHNDQANLLIVIITRQSF